MSHKFTYARTYCDIYIYIYLCCRLERIVIYICWHAIKINKDKNLCLVRAHMRKHAVQKQKQLILNPILARASVFLGIKIAA